MTSTHVREGCQTTVCEGETVVPGSSSPKDDSEAPMEDVNKSRLNQETAEPGRTFAQDLPSKAGHVAQSISEGGVQILQLDEEEIAFFDDLKQKAAKHTVLGRLSTASPASPTHHASRLI